MKTAAIPLAVAFEVACAVAFAQVRAIPWRIFAPAPRWSVWSG